MWKLEEFADRLAAAVVARQNVLDPGYFSARARNLSSSGSSLYTLSSSPLSPSPPVSFKTRLRDEMKECNEEKKIVFQKVLEEVG